MFCIAVSLIPESVHLYQLGMCRWLTDSIKLQPFDQYYTVIATVPLCVMGNRAIQIHFLTNEINRSLCEAGQDVCQRRLPVSSLYAEMLKRMRPVGWFLLSRGCR